MKREEFDAMLADCIADCRVSRGERRALAEILKDDDLAAGEITVLRAHAFKAAAEHVNDPRSREILGGVEDVVGLLLAAAPEPARKAASSAYFSPHDDGVDKLIRLFRSAKDSVDMCVFTIPDNRISRAIERAHDRGVRMRIVSDDDKAEDLGSDIGRLAERGIRVAVDATENHMHHKFAIFDRRALLTGSYNWTRAAAESNHENFIVTDDQRLVRAFRDEFEQLWTQYA